MTSPSSVPAQRCGEAERSGSPGVSRRHLFKMGAGGLAALTGLAGRPRSSLAYRSTPPPPPSPTDPIIPVGFGLDPALWILVSRITQGFSESAYAEAEAMGYDNYLEWQLHPENIADPGMDQRLAPYDTLNMTPKQVFDLYGGNQSIPGIQLVEAMVLRSVYSRKQLYERMVEFWSDHFTIYIKKGLCTLLKNQDDREVIRRYAMTTFPQLLEASTRSAAMSFYLDNVLNTEYLPQENYAREIMELHTLGVDGGYTQEDVENVARCFTGWAFETETYSTQFGEFRFFPESHDYGPKVVLGHNIPAGGGESDGMAVLGILLTHPKTAQRIALKLCKWFVGYNPPQHIVDRAAQEYLTTGGDIKSMLRIILAKEALPIYATPKLRRPFHLMTSTLRAAAAQITDVRSLTYRLGTMNHTPFHRVTPDGYPDTVEAWGTSLLPRWQYVTALFDRSLYGVAIDPDALVRMAAGEGGSGGIAPEGPSAPTAQSQLMNLILTGGAMSLEDVQRVQAFLDAYPIVSSSRRRAAFGLLASSPSFQWY